MLYFRINLDVFTLYFDIFLIEAHICLLQTRSDFVTVDEYIFFSRVSIVCAQYIYCSLLALRRHHQSATTKTPRAALFVVTKAVNEVFSKK